MDFRDRSIITQVAFKGAVDACHGMDLTDPDAQAAFEHVFSYLTESLFAQVGDPEEQAARVIQAHFPGAAQVPQHQPQPQLVPQPQQYPSNPPPPQQQPFVTQGGVAVKGNQFGPLPDWLYAQAAAKGVTEVYDNRDRVQGSNRPWFKATSGGTNAAGFWPPRA